MATVVNEKVSERWQDAARSVNQSLQLLRRVVRRRVTRKKWQNFFKGNSQTQEDSYQIDKVKNRRPG